MVPTKLKSGGDASPPSPTDLRPWNLDVSLLQEGALIHKEGVDAAEGSPKTLTSPGAACIPAELLKAAVVSREEKNINKTRSSDNTKHIGRSLQSHRQSGLLSLSPSLSSQSLVNG